MRKPVGFSAKIISKDGQEFDISEHVKTVTYRDTDYPAKCDKYTMNQFDSRVVKNDH